MMDIVAGRWPDFLRPSVNQRVTNRRLWLPARNHISELGFGEAEMLQILRAVNQPEKFGDKLSLRVVQLSVIRTGHDDKEFRNPPESGPELFYRICKGARRDRRPAGLFIRRDKTEWML